MTNQNSTEKRKIAVTLVGALKMNSYGGASFKCTVANVKAEYNGRIADHYKKPSTVELEAYPMDFLDSVGAELDTVAILAEYNRLVDIREQEHRDRRNKESEAQNDEWDVRRATLDAMKLSDNRWTKITGTYNEYVCTTGLRLEKKHAGVVVAIEVRTRDGWFVVEQEHTYGRGNSKKSKAFAKVKTNAIEVLAEATRAVEWKQQAEQNKKTGLAEAQENFGADVKEGSYGERDSRGHYTGYSCYEVDNNTEKYAEKKSVKFSGRLTDDEKNTRVYTIKNIEGYFTGAEIRAILRVVRGTEK